jgi:hypothetical protein
MLLVLDVRFLCLLLYREEGMLEISHSEVLLIEGGNEAVKER